MEINLMGDESLYTFNMPVARRYVSAAFDLVDFLVKNDLYNMKNRKYVGIRFADQMVNPNVYSENNGLNLIGFPNHHRVPMSDGMRCYIKSNLMYIQIIIVDIEKQHFFSLVARSVVRSTVSKAIHTEDY